MIVYGLFWFVGKFVCGVWVFILVIMCGCCWG